MRGENMHTAKNKLYTKIKAHDYISDFTLEAK